MCGLLGLTQLFSPPTCVVHMSKSKWLERVARLYCNSLSNSFFFQVLQERENIDKTVTSLLMMHFKPQFSTHDVNMINKHAC